MKIVKAEILFSRKCNLSCHYCGMVTGEENSRSLEDWKKGINNLKLLGCEFAAFYGAEPLLEMDLLPEVVGYAEQIGISTTVITSGAVSDFREKLKLLHARGAKSISMSYDLVALNRSSSVKSSNTIDHLLYFKGLGDVRDVAAITTLTRTNFRSLPESVERNSELGIWTFFDFIHPDRGLPGTKCRGNGDELIFQNEDFEELYAVLSTVQDMKKTGRLVHVSDGFLQLMKSDNFSVLKNYNWNCSKSIAFPSWVTIDCDGSVHYCDDFQEQRKKPKFDMTTLSRNWGSFCEYGEDLISRRCRGCCWSTHVDAHYVKLGINPINSYVHGDR